MSSTCGSSAFRADSGYENWRVTDAADRSFVLKVGPITSATKWAAARASYDLSASVGVPLPGLVHFAEHDDYVVRVFEWIDGRSPLDMAADPERVARLFTSLGTAIAKLHSIELDGFSSRLDGSAPSFRSWANYAARARARLQLLLGEVPPIGRDL